MGIIEETNTKETKSTIMAAQGQALATNWHLQRRNDHVSPLCRLRKEADETKAPILNECSELPQRDVSWPIELLRFATDPNYEAGRIWKAKKVEVMPISVGVLWTVTEDIEARI